MVFSSAIFLFCFLPITLAIYYSLRGEFRNGFLLFASLFFYGWGEPQFVYIIFLSICINYSFGYLIARYQGRGREKQAKLALWTGVAANCGLLFYYKYYDFFLSSVNFAFHLSLPLQHIVLPIGISFFTFQGLSYVADVYWRKVDFQKNFLRFALFKALFPQLIAGPIVRYVDVHDQIDYREHTLDRFAEGVRRFIIGLSKKVVIANTLGAVADGVFGVPVHQNSPALAWAGIVCYAFQIHFDFSGYSDMAIGLAKMFGFDFKENFNYPYTAKSITEFWRRWHISLSTWFRDYVYIPLGGNRSGNVYYNLFLVFALTGLWHGAAWNFIVWGLWHGCFLVLERIGKKLWPDLQAPAALCHLYTLFVVLLGWVFFRAADLTYAMKYIQILLGIGYSYDVGFSVWYYLDSLTVLMLGVACVVACPIYPRLLQHCRLSFNRLLLHNAYLALLLLICVMFVSTSTYNPFIYFRF